MNWLKTPHLSNPFITKRIRNKVEIVHDDMHVMVNLILEDQQQEVNLRDSYSNF